MGRLFLRLMGKRVAHKALAKHAGNGKLLDIKFGMALLRDRRVTPGPKLLALGLGLGLVLMMIAMELPLEGLCGLIMPLFGFVDGIVDGMEMLIGPILFGALLLPLLAPKGLVQRIREERLGYGPTLGTGPVIDVESRATVS